MELPRGATGVEWGTDLSFVGVYVRALLPGGAAEQSGAVAPGDQLVAIDGDAVFDATFDAAMARLAASNVCLLYTSPSPRDATLSRMPSSA